MTDDEFKRCDDLAKTCADQIGEYADGVVVMFTYRDETGTRVLDRSNGNVYTCEGMINDFITRQRAVDMARAVKSDRNRNP